MGDLSAARLAGIVYALYFAVAIGSTVLAKGDMAALSRGNAAAPATAAWVGSTAIYAVLVVLLARLVWDVDPRIAVAAIVLGLIGCAIQIAASLLGLGRSGPIAALFFFGLFMVAYGWLMLQSGTMPSAVGILFIVAGIGWCAPVVPGFPIAMGTVVQGFGGITEIVLMLWLLIHG